MTVIEQLKHEAELLTEPLAQEVLDFLLYKSEAYAAIHETMAGNDDYISIADISKGEAWCGGFEVVINVVANNLFSTTTTTK